MKTAVLTVLSVLLSSASNAASAAPSPTSIEGFHFGDFEKPSRIGGRIEGVPQDRITSANLLPYGDKGYFIGSAANQAQFEEAVSVWKQIFLRAGIEPGPANFDA